MKCELCGNHASKKIIARNWQKGQLLDEKSILLCSSCTSKFDSMSPDRFYDFLGVSENYDEFDRELIETKKAPEIGTSKQKLAWKLVDFIPNLSDKDYPILKRLNKSQLDAIVSALKEPQVAERGE